MINYEEKFFAYLKGKMNSLEKNEFEDELNHSEILKNEFIEYKKLNGIIDEIKNVQLNKDYSESIITEFRKRKENKKIKIISPTIKYALASIIIIVAGYFLMTMTNKENLQEIKLNLEDFSEAELNSWNSNYYYSTSAFENNIDDDAVSKIDSIYKENLSESLVEALSEKKLEDFISINNVSDVDEYLSDNDVDMIYNQLINKEIL
jgi:hypothetical protein